VDDGSQPWPEGRPEVEIGTLSILRPVPEDDERQRDLAFVPTNLVGGIAPSADPMLKARTQSYRVSADRRMVAP
jgi:catalase